MNSEIPPWIELPWLGTPLCGKHRLAVFFCDRHVFLL